MAFYQLILKTTATKKGANMVASKVRRQGNKYISVAIDLKTARKLKKIDPTKSYAELIRGLVNG